MENKMICMKTMPLVHQAIQAKMIHDVWNNEGLRDKLRHDPRATIEAMIGHKIDPNIQIKFVECSDNEVAFTIPGELPSKSAKSELSESQLDAVAGGSTIGDIVSIAALIPTLIGQAGQAITKSISGGDAQAKKNADDFFKGMQMPGQWIAKNVNL
jgi:hypothetical protein